MQGIMSISPPSPMPMQIPSVPISTPVPEAIPELESRPKMTSAQRIEGARNTRGVPSLSTEELYNSILAETMERNLGFGPRDIDTAIELSLILPNFETLVAEANRIAEPDETGRYADHEAEMDIAALKSGYCAGLVAADKVVKIAKNMDSGPNPYKVGKTMVEAFKPTQPAEGPNGRVDELEDREYEQSLELYNRGLQLAGLDETYLVGKGDLIYSRRGENREKFAPKQQTQSILQPA